MAALSIITPTFRREALLAEAIASVRKIEGIEWEMLIGDDSPEGSAEATVRAFQDERIRYWKNPKPTGGLPAIIRNKLAKEARGQYLYFLDDDDRVVAQTLNAMVAALSGKAAGVAVGDVRPFGDDPKALRHEEEYFAHAKSIWTGAKRRHLIVARILFMDSPLVCSSCIVRKSAFDAIQGFDTGILLCEDSDMYLRAIRNFGFTHVPEVLLERRCGIASLINAGNAAQFRESYQRIHANYRSQFGAAEFLALKSYSLLLKAKAKLST
jgi:GT2 family glycosyltransferase